MDWKKKLTSRKFWVALCEFVTMLVIALGKDQETAVQISALIMAGAAVVAYIIGEGLVDAAHADADIPDIGFAEYMPDENKPPEEE